MIVCIFENTKIKWGVLQQDYSIERN
jgi:hypothetical protein